MANTIENVKNGKYYQKTAANKFDKIHLETNDGQVILSSAITISGTTYSAGTALSSILAVINSTGGQYRLRNYNPQTDGPIAAGHAIPVYLEVSTDGGTTWSIASTLEIAEAKNALTADSATSATDASYASKIGNSLIQSAIGSATQPVYIASDGTVTAATAYSSATVNKANNVDLTAAGSGTSSITISAGNGTAASFTVNGVASATKATQDASGNVITSTYATKTELANLESGLTQAYVTNSTTISSGPFMALIVDKSSAQQTATITSVSANTSLPLLVGSVKVSELKVGDTVYITEESKCDWFLAQKSQTGSNAWALVFYSIEADAPSLSGYVTGSSLTANKIVLGNGNSAVKASSAEISTTALAANATGSDSNILTEKATMTTIKTVVGSHSGIDKVGTVTSVAVSNGGGLSVSGSPITSSGTITVTHATPTGATAGTLGSSTARYYIKTITTDAYGHVTGVTTGNETVTDTNTWRSIKVDGSEKLGTGTGTGAVDFVDGTGIDATWTASGSKISFNLKTSGVTAGTYSAVTVDAYGRATAGAQMIKWDTEANFATGDYSDLAINGILITTGA